MLSLTQATDQGFGVIRGVTLRLTDQEGTDEGSYWRRVGFELVDGNGEDAYGYAMATNTSLLEEIAVSASVDADVSWISLEDQSTVETQLTQETHEVGEASYP